jgi:hypothetical protein
MLRRAIPLALVAGSLLAPTVARANPYDIVGYDSQGASSAGANIAFGTSAGIAYSNPALIVAAPASLELSVLARSSQLYARPMAKPPGTDVPLSIYGSNLGVLPGVQTRALPTSELLHPRSDTAVEGIDSDLQVGIVTPTWIDRLRGALSIIVPLTSSRKSSVVTGYSDEREALFSNQLHFMRFGEWDRLPVVTAGFAYQLLPWLSLGISMQFAATVQAKLQVYVPDATVQSYAQSDLSSSLAVKLRPIFGARAEPVKGLVLGATWRGESYFRIEGADEITLWDYHTSDPTKTVPKRSTQSFPMTIDYQPMEVALGGGVQIGDVRAQANIVWQRWSHYLDQHGERPEDAATFPASPFPSAYVDPSAYEFHDVVAVQGSLEWSYLSFASVTVGAAYFPSPVPPQIGRTNFVDSDLLGLTGGTRWRFPMWDRSTSLGLNLGLWRMQTRTTYKNPSQVVDEFPDGARSLTSNAPLAEAQGLQTNNPGFPGYTAFGYMLVGGISLMQEL